MPLQPRPEVAGLLPCPHGGPDYGMLANLGLTPEEVLDFSVSANPFGPPPEVRKVLEKICIHRYPDSLATRFREALAGRLGVGADNILAGSGSLELLRLAALAYLGTGDTALIIKPTFGEYEVACRLMGCRVVEVAAREESGFTPDMAELLSLIRQHRPRAVFICNPNNPTGHYLSRDEVSSVLEAVGQGMVILDEAYISFVEGAWPSLGLIDRGNLLVLRSLTKDYALAGLRLGYGVASAEIINALRKVCPPWNVNAFAQEAGLAALGAEGYLQRCLPEIRQARDFLMAGFSRLGFVPLPSRANFFLVKVGQAVRLHRALLQRKILVRDCTSFGLPQYIRVAARTLEECRRLVTALEEIKEE